MIKQLVPSDVCLKCQGCCRFKDADSVWSPCLLDEEILDLIDKEGIPAAALSINRRLQLVPNSKGEDFLCPFLNIEENKCKIYSTRPLECQLYPFLITLRDKKVLLTVDLNCPYVKEKLNTPEFKAYLGYLTDYFNSPTQLELLKDNPQIIQAYDDVLDVVELQSPDAPK
ncbi:MAG: YkgJ family cysteine cluster protein [Candidatus Omnitrophica bacterium]|nr:YkgJ family cysteine cluster protein [Candidatus Omnitrophota bacterium]